MLQTKNVLCVCALVVLGSAALTPPAASVSKPLAIEDLEPCEDSKAVDISPLFRMNSNSQDTTLGVTASIQCMKDPVATEEELFYTQITLTAPIYDPEALPPSNPNDEEIANTSDDEHVRVYFTNADKRMLELQFNRFTQKSARLLKRPYNELNKDLPTEAYYLTVKPNEEVTEWTAVVTFPPEYLPANVTSLNVVVVDPSQEVEASRYIMNYRLYNHPISIPDMQVPSSYQKVRASNIVPVNLNTEYSELWNGIE